MKTTGMVSVLTALLVTVGSISWAASNLETSKSNVNKVGGPKGSSVSASINLTGPTDTQIVYTPTTGGFFVTQVCVSPVPNLGVRLDAAGLGGIAVVGTTFSNTCQSFLPDGVFVTLGSDITCSVSGAPAGSFFCMITGILQ